MKKILSMLVFTVMTVISYAQFSCSGTFVVTEPKNGARIKDCHVCANDKHAEFLLFDTEVIVPVVNVEHKNVNGMCGDVYYLDKERMSYIFYGKSEDAVLCVVSLVTDGERWTFAKAEHRKIK